MKKLLSLATLIFSSLAFGQSGPDVQVFGFPHQNLSLNGGAESGVLPWVGTGVSPSRGTGQQRTGSFSMNWNPTASSQFLNSGDTTIPDGTSGCIAVFYYDGAGTADIEAYVEDSSGNQLSETVLISSAASDYTQVQLPFACVGSGTPVRLELEALGNAAQIILDDLYIGEDYRVGSVAQAYQFGSLTYPADADCDWSNSTASTTAPGVFAADTGCTAPTVTGNVTAPDTLIPGFVIPAGSPSGTYKIEAVGRFRASRNAASASVITAIYDGTTYFGLGHANINTGGATSNTAAMTTIVATVPYTSSASNTTYEIAISCQAATCTNTVTAIDSAIVFNVTYFPDSSQIVQRADITDLGGSVTASGCSNWSTTSGSMASFTATTGCTYSTIGSNITSPATQLLAGKANSLLPGNYYVTFTVSFRANESTSGSQVCEFEIYDGTTSSKSISVTQLVSKGTETVSSISAMFSYTSAQTAKQFEVRGFRSGGNNSCATSNGGYVFSLIPVNQATPRAFIPGSFYYSDTVINGGAAGISTFAKGTYTPTLTNTTNVAVSVLNAASYSRIGNRVQVTISVDIDPTAAAPTSTTLGFTLPFPPTSNFSTAYQALGQGSSSGNQGGGTVQSVIGALTASYQYSATTTANVRHSFTFEYNIE